MGPAFTEADLDFGLPALDPKRFVSRLPSQRPLPIDPIGEMPDSDCEEVRVVPAKQGPVVLVDEKGGFGTIGGENDRALDID